jgi:hypothetical protein
VFVVAPFAQTNAIHDPVAEAQLGHSDK